MEKRGASSKSSLFLMEMIIAILFLTVAAAVCMRLFVQAHVTGEASENLTRAVMAAQSVTENLKAAEEPEAWLTGAAGVRPLHPGELWEFGYDPDWRLLTENEAATAYWLRVRRLGGENGLWLAETAVYGPDSPEPIFFLPCAIYAPEGGAP
ncbi:MAG: hypothetical protein LBS10_02100 [Gracilibacteraceae bacterium]|jgi:hypothetical protein|nr:hypothetical protein [Gracilibacteraceae bacterium]